MFTKTHNLNKEKTKIRKRDFKDKTKQETQKKQKMIDEKKPFTCNILMLFFS